MLERRFDDRGFTFFSSVVVGGFMVVELVVDDSVVGVVQSLSLPLLLAMFVVDCQQTHSTCKYVVSPQTFPITT